MRRRLVMVAAATAVTRLRAAAIPAGWGTGYISMSSRISLLAQ